MSAAHVLESTFGLALERALNAPGRLTRVVRVNAGTFVKRDERGHVLGAVRGAPAGTADLVGIAGPTGLYFETELKADGGRIRPAQRARAATVRRLGGVYLVVEHDDSASLADNVLRGVREVDDALLFTMARRGASQEDLALAWRIPAAAVEASLLRALGALL